MSYSQLNPKTYLTPGGCGYVKLWKTLSDGTKEMVRRILPHPNNPEIILSAMISETTLLTIDREGTTSLFQISDQKELANRRFESIRNAGARLSADRERIYLTIEPGDGRSKRLIQLNSKSLEIMANIQLPPKTDINRIWISDSKTVHLYFVHGGDLGKEAGDGLYRIDISQDKIESLPFSPPTPDSFTAPPIDLCAQCNIGVRPDYGSIRIETTSGEKRYFSQAQLFALDTGEEIRTVPLREFHAQHVFEDENPAFALTALEKGHSNDDYLEARDEFFERIDQLLFCHREKAFWVAFQHGLIRKVSFDGKKRSSLVAHPGEQGALAMALDPFRRTGFDTPIAITPDDRKLSFGEPTVSFDPTAVDLYSGKELIPLNEGTYTIESEEPTVNDDLELSWNTIPLESGDPEKSCLKALRTVLSRSESLDQNRDGLLFRFRFSADDGEVDEASFFQSLQEFPESWPLLRDFLKNITAAKLTLQYDDRLPAGFYALNTLVLAGLEYIEDLIGYIASGIVPGNHECEALSELVTVVIDRYGWSKETVELLLARAYHQNQDGVDQLQEFIESDGFLEFLNNSTNRSWFQNHPMMEELQKDYFYMLRPLENRLYEAILWEQLEMIEELILTGVDLNLQHPEYAYSALGCALKVGNIQTIDLLTRHGATIEAEEVERINQEQDAQDEVAMEDYVIADEVLDSFGSQSKKQPRFDAPETEDERLPNSAPIALEDQNDPESCEEAIDQIIERIQQPGVFVETDILRFEFSTPDGVISEEEFFQSLPISDTIIDRLRNFFLTLIQVTPGPLWYDRKIQAGMFAMERLVLHDKLYISDFIFYIKSKLIDNEQEERYPNELIDQVIEQYGWCYETMELVVARGMSCGGSFGFDELRMRIKKEGLREYLREDEQHLESFFHLIRLEGVKPEDSRVDQLRKLI